MNTAHKLAQYVMRGRSQAIFIGLLFSVVPLFTWVSSVVVALVTLRQGAKTGAVVLLWVMLPNVVLASVVDPSLWLYGVLGGGVLSYGLAVLLRYTGSWTFSLQTLMLLSLVVLLSIHLLMPDVLAFWSKQFSNYILALKLRLKLSIMDEEVQFFTDIATGLQMAGLLLSNLWNLVLARWLQSLLYNPGQLAPELKSIRLHKWASGVLILVLLASGYGLGFARDSLPVVALVATLAGLSCLQAATDVINITKPWLFTFYIILAIAFSYLAPLLVLLALLDSGWDLRAYLQRKRC